MQNHEMQASRGLADRLHTLAAACVAALRRGFDGWTRGVQISITHRALARLDDRTLADIGLHRSNLRWQAQQVVDAARAKRAESVAQARLAGRVGFDEAVTQRAAANDEVTIDRAAA